jgi:4-hydroxy-3-methylbut-2-enyl diphosphate reductase
VVQNTIAYLQDKFNATMEEVVIRREEVHFPLPKALREYAKDAAN